MEDSKTSEIPTINHWTFDIFKQFLRDSVLEDGKILYPNMPDSIDLGFFMDDTRKAVRKQGTDGCERLRIVGIEKDPPHGFRFSKLMKGFPYGFDDVSINIDDPFTPEVWQLLAGLGNIIHTHPRPIFFSPPDLIAIQLGHGSPPGITVGTDTFSMFALRSDSTPPLFNELNSVADPASIMERAKKDLLNKYFNEYRELDLITEGRTHPVHSLPDRSIARINSIYERILRREAREKKIGIFICPVDTNTVKRVDLNRDISSQI